MTEIRIRAGKILKVYQVEKFDKRSKADCEMIGTWIHSILNACGSTGMENVTVLITDEKYTDIWNHRKDVTLHIESNSTLDQCIRAFRSCKLVKVPSDYTYKSMYNNYRSTSRN